jgi:hypothetical protein
MSVHTSFASFGASLQKYGEQEVPEIQKGTLTVIALTGAKSLTELTPVDTGRAKGNWQFTVGQPADGEVERTDPSPAGAPGAAATSDVLREIANWKPGDWLWFHNGVPYIQVLNDGGENREAHHMLERTVEYLKNWLEGS